MTNPALKRTPLALPGVGVSLLPKLMCPACWLAYAGIVSALGLGFLISAKCLLPLTIVFLTITAISRAFMLHDATAMARSGLALSLTS
jgi:hypothetical protein